MARSPSCKPPSDLGCHFTIFHEKSAAGTPLIARAGLPFLGVWVEMVRVLAVDLDIFEAVLLEKKGMPMTAGDARFC
jgi:hypothetical protein